MQEWEEQRVGKIGVTPGGADAGGLGREAAVIHRPLPSQAAAPMIQMPSYVLLCLP